MTDDNSYPLLKRPLSIGLLVFVLVTILTQYLTYQQYLIKKDEERQKVTHEMEVVKDRLKTALSYGLSATKTLAFIIGEYGDPHNFNKAAKAILESNKYIDALELTRKGAITHVYPLKGNEAAIGLNVLDASLRNIEAYKALEKKELFFAGPLELKQGGIAVVGRLPIFIDNDFWGFSVVLIKLSTLLRAAGIDTLQSGNFIYQVSKINPNTLKEEFFLPGTIPDNQGQFVSVDVPSGEWKLYVMPKNNPKILFLILVFSFMGLMLSVTAASFAWQLARQPEELNRLVEEKILQLAASEKYFRALIENSSDAIVLLDAAGKVLYQSPSTDRILGYTLKEIQTLDGLQLIYPEDRDEDLTMFAQLVQSPNSVFSRSHRIKHKDGHYVGIEGTYTNLLNDENVGAVVYNYRDVTNKVEAEQKLATSEALYSQLIQHLPVAVYNCDTEGRVLLYNQAAVNLWGRMPQVGSDLWCGSWKIFKPDGTFLPLEDWPMALSVKEKRPLLGEGIIIERPDGSQRNVVVNPTPVFDYKKNITGYVNILIDITDQKKAEEEIILSQFRLLAILENTTDLIWLVDKDYKLLFSNSHFKDFLLKLTGKEIQLGNNVKDFIPDSYKDSLIILCERALSGEQFSVEQIRNYNGKEAIIEYFFNPIRNAQNEVTGFSAFMRNITDRKMADKKLAESEFHYRSLIEQASDAIFIANSKGQYIDVNTSASTLLGYTREELLSMSGEDILFYEENIKLLPQRYQILREGKSGIIETRLKRKDGTPVDVETNSKMLTDGRFVGIVRDITQRKKAERTLAESENRLRTIIQTEPECVKLLGLQGELIEMNPAGLAMIEADNFEQVKGKSMLGIINKPNRKAFAALTKNVFNGLSGTLEFEMTGLKGASRWLETHATPLKDAEGKVIFLLGVTRDITERKRSEDLIRKSESELREAQRLAQCGNWNLDLEASKLTWSEELYNVFATDKKTFEETRGSFIHLVDEEDRERVIQISLRAQKKGMPFDIEYHITTPAGEKRVIHELGYAERNAKGKIIRLFGTAQNITLRKKAEQAIIESEMSYKNLFKSNPSPMIIWDFETLQIIDCNEEALIKYGYTRKEFLKLTIRDLRPVENIAAIEQTTKTEGMYEEIHKKIKWYKKKSGELMLLDITGHLIDYNGRRATLALLNDITEKLKVEAEIISSNQQLKALTAHLQIVREEERTAIAREIHDELGQQLTGLKMDASWIGKRMTGEDKSIQVKLAGMLSLIDDTVKSVRRISTQLRPGILDDLGLVAALEWQCHEFEQRTGINTSFFTELTYLNQEGNLLINIFRIHQEALTNIARHARATQIITTLVKKNGYLNLAIKDNGIGFDIEEARLKKSWGLIGMKERVLLFQGELTIESERLKGTVITLRVPLAEPTKQPS